MSKEAPRHLLTDVSLAKVELTGDGRCVKMEFIDMQDGRPCAFLIAHGVSLLNYHNTFTEEPEALPVYVGEVICTPLGSVDQQRLLARLGYGFLGRGIETFVPACHYWIHAEGGEVATEIICNDYTFEQSAPL